MHKAGFGTARQGQESNGECLHKTSRSQGSRQREHGASKREQDSRQASGRAKSGKEALVREPLADKSVQWGKAGNGDGADQKTEGCNRHGTDQSPQFFHVSRPRRMQHRPSSQEQKTLEDGVIQRVKERGDQCYTRELRMPRNAEHQRGAEADEDDPDILNTVVGQ